MVKRKCDNCGRWDDDRLFFFVRDPRTQQRIGFCSVSCYIEGMKARGVYEQIKKEAIERFERDKEAYESVKRGGNGS